MQVAAAALGGFGGTPFVVGASSAARRLNGVRSSPPNQLLDAAVRGVELLAAELVELLAALPELDRLVERRLSGLEALDDFLQLFLRALERHVTSSTRPPKPPSASSTSTRVPAATWCPARTIVPPARTIAYPRSSVACGASVRRRAAACSSRALRRRRASAGARAR